MLWGLLITAVSSLFVGFLPLFGGFGYESSLAHGVLLPVVAAVTASRHVVRHRALPLDALLQGLLIGFALASAAGVVTLLHGYRVGHCDFWSGLLGYLLGPAFGALMGGAWGSLVTLAVCESVRPPGLMGSILLGASGPVAGIALSLYRFLTSPMIFAYDPFFGYFSGTLYDTVIDHHGLWSYRAGSLASLSALAVLVSLAQREPDGRLRWRWGFPIGSDASAWFGARLPVRAFALRLGGMLAALVSLTISLSGTELGHYQTTASIKEALGHVAESKRCDVVYASGIIKRDAHILARDCDAHVDQIERFFALKDTPRITVFLFASDRQKGELMGASNTYIAKPWRSEVYLQQRGYPHPVLGHELAHVIAGQFGRGPFRVAGPLAGWLPDPGRIEGFAVAAAPREYDDVTTLDWAVAMQRLELLPPIPRLFKLSFLAVNSAAAYTAAGAFVGWLHASYGAEPLRQWYAGAEPVSAFGKTLEQLESNFVAMLKARQVDERTLRVAKARFDRPAIFGRACPHVVDEAAGEAYAALGRLDAPQARDGFQEVLELDPTHFGARVALGDCELRAGQAKQAEAHFQKLLEDDSLHHTERAAIQERLADLALRAGDGKRAASLYEQLDESIVDEDELRSIDVKRWAATTESEAGRAAIVDLLIGDPELGVELSVATASLANWAAEDAKQGLADYLLGRNFYARGWFEEAAEYLDAAIDKQLELKRVAREARRTRLFVACALGQKKRAQAVFNEYNQLEGVSPARLAGVAALARRCELSVPEDKSKPKPKSPAEP